jgi:hypothetical protein
MRRPTAEVLERFATRGTSLVLIWWGFAWTAVLFAPLVLLLSAALAGADRTLLAATTTVGVLAAAVRFLGARARAHERPSAQAPDRFVGLGAHGSCLSLSRHALAIA